MYGTLWPFPWVLADLVYVTISVIPTALPLTSWALTLPGENQWLPFRGADANL